MTPEQIREIVKITIDELDKRKLLKNDPYQSVLQEIEPKLKEFFDGTDKSLSNVIKVLSDDTYVDILFLQYRDGRTLDWIANALDVDISTVKRNKKRLIYRVYELLDY